MPLLQSPVPGQDAGFDLLEIPLLEPATFDRVAAKHSLAGQPLTVSALLGQSADTDISSADADVVAAGEAKLMTALEILSELESEYFVGVLYSQLTKYSEPATERGRRNSIEVLRRVAERASTLGIRLGLEVGTVDFDELFRGLRLIGYDGPIAFESFSTTVVHPSLSRSLAVWRNLWVDSDDLGAHANAFIRGKLHAVETIDLE